MHKATLFHNTEKKNSFSSFNPVLVFILKGNLPHQLLKQAIELIISFGDINYNAATIKILGFKRYLIDFFKVQFQC
jgi:hypothetical protein